MEYRCLGRTGLRVSRLALGTMNFGPLTPEVESHAIMDKALELGINFFDTADVYGWKKGEGWTEQIVGRWLAQGGGRRERIVLGTKVYGGMGSGPNDRGLSAYHIRRACEGSLRRLQTDHIDLYQMHHVDRRTPVEEFLQAMEQLTREGKIVYLGCSNFPAWQIARTQMAAQRRHFLGLVSEQCLYSLADRTVELEVLPAAREFGLGIIPWSPLSGGLLAGALTKESSGRRASDVVQKKLQARREAVAQWESLCGELGQPPDRVALAWLLRNPLVTAPIVGPRTIEHLCGSLDALTVKLDDDAWNRVEAIWPGPGGEAPEAYSW